VTIALLGIAYVAAVVILTGPYTAADASNSAGHVRGTHASGLKWMSPWSAQFWRKPRNRLTVFSWLPWNGVLCLPSVICVGMGAMGLGMVEQRGSWSRLSLLLVGASAIQLALIVLYISRPLADENCATGGAGTQ
jgi:hypothetical protein